MEDLYTDEESAICHKVYVNKMRWPFFNFVFPLSSISFDFNMVHICNGMYSSISFVITLLHLHSLSVLKIFE